MQVEKNTIQQYLTDDALKLRKYLDSKILNDLLMLERRKHLSMKEKIAHAWRRLFHQECSECNKREEGQLCFRHWAKYAEYRRGKQ